MKKLFYSWYSKIPSDTIVEKYLLIITTATLFFFSAYTLFMSVNSHLEFIKFAYQHEYMEGAALKVTKLYLNQENPFDIMKQPQDTYVYGFLYSLVVFPFAKGYGNTLVVHFSLWTDASQNVEKREKVFEQEIKGPNYEQKI